MLNCINASSCTSATNNRTFTPLPVFHQYCSSGRNVMKGNSTWDGCHYLPTRPLHRTRRDFSPPSRPRRGSTLRVCIQHVDRVQEMLTLSRDLCHDLLTFPGSFVFLFILIGIAACICPCTPKDTTDEEQGSAQAATTRNGEEDSSTRQPQGDMEEVGSQASTIVNGETDSKSADRHCTNDDIEAVPPWENTERVFYADASGYVLQGDPRYCLQCGLDPVPMGIYSKMLLPPGHHATCLEPGKHRIVH